MVCYMVGSGEGLGKGRATERVRLNSGKGFGVGSMEGHAGQNGIDDCDTIAPEGMVQLHDHSLRLAVDGLGDADIVTPVTHETAIGARRACSENGETQLIPLRQ